MEFQTVLANKGTKKQNEKYITKLNFLTCKIKISMQIQKGLTLL